jgi:broad specificity phosphatase PhoE
MIKHFKLFLFIFILGIFSNVYGHLFEFDDELVEKMKLEKKYLIVQRHFESSNNLLDIVTSNPSPGYALTPAGHQQATIEGEELSQIGISAIYTSPIYRCLQSSELLGKILQLAPNQIYVDPLLTIQSFGNFNGVDYDLYKDQFGSFEAMLTGSINGVEPGSEVFERSRQFLWKIASSDQNVILIVTHAFNICHMNMSLKGELGPLIAPGEYLIYDFTQ